MGIRPITIDGDVAFVPLTKGCVAVIDANDVHLVCGWNWQAESGRSTTYAKRRVKTPNGAKELRMHRVILGVDPKNMEVDHIDGDGLNNRRANLRLATCAQNQYNSRVRSDNVSGFKGVSRSANKWLARIRHKGKRHHLGVFDSPKDAYIAYCEASQMMHGEFGRTP